MNKDTERSLWMAEKLGYGCSDPKCSGNGHRTISLRNSAEDREAAYDWLAVNEEIEACYSPSNKAFGVTTCDGIVISSFTYSTRKEALFAAIDYLMALHDDK